ncbi:hypothetical protein Csa_019221 [Cucumis sativus]|nr:hypothetical protein Csa_019221 [Cucumis sativus]
MSSSIPSHATVNSTATTNFKSRILPFHFPVLKSFRSTLLSTNALSNSRFRKSAHQYDAQSTTNTLSKSQNRTSDSVYSLPSTVDLLALCEEGKVIDVLEYIGQGAKVDYGVFTALLNSCCNLKLLEAGRRVDGLLKGTKFHRAEELMFSLDPSTTSTTIKPSLPPRRKQSSTNMLEEKDREGDILFGPRSTSKSPRFI